MIPEGASPVLEIVDASRPRMVDFDNATDQHWVIDKPCFLDHLRLEKQRAQRSGSALSILMLIQEHSNGKDSENISFLLKAVHSKIRETDIVGYIDQHTLGVLLPYTDKEGAKKFGEKIMNGFNRRQLSVAGATYPDQLFDSLADIGSVSSDILSLMLEDSIKFSRIKLQIKRGIDIVGSIAALLILAPLMLITAALVKYSSPGPIIFKQTRLGYKGVPFTFYKFRSMQTGTSDEIHRDFVLKHINGNLSAVNNATDKGKLLYKIKSDPRVTRVGRFIRKTSIDELPQLYNVLKGEMSLVGPRPPLAYEAEKYQAWQLRRILEMKPGITGLWQVEGRSRTGFSEAVRLDIRYLKTWTLLLDIKILFKTVKEVLLCKGAV